MLFISSSLHLFMSSSLQSIRISLDHLHQQLQSVLRRSECAHHVHAAFALIYSPTGKSAELCRVFLLLSNNSCSTVIQQKKSLHYLTSPQFISLVCHYPYSNSLTPSYRRPPSHYMEHLGAQSMLTSCRVAHLETSPSQPCMITVFGQRLCA